MCLFVYTCTSACSCVYLAVSTYCLATCLFPTCWFFSDIYTCWINDFWFVICNFFFYLMEPFVSLILWVLNLARIPWNLGLQILMTIRFNFVGWINFRKLISTLYLFVSLFHRLMFNYQYLHYIICISGITQNLSKYHSKSHLKISMLIETYFDQKVPWNILQCSMELFEQHLNNTCGSMEFHGT